MGDLIELLAMPAHYSAALSPEWIIFDPANRYVVRFGNPALALMHNEQLNKWKLYPWLQASEPGGQQHAFELRHTVLEPTHDPVGAIGAWLIANGAKWDDRFQLLHGNSPALMVFNLRKHRAEVAA